MLLPIKNLSTYDFQKVKSFLMDTSIVPLQRRKPVTLRMQGDSPEAKNCVSVWFRYQGTRYRIGDLANIDTTRRIFQYLQESESYTARYLQIGKLCYAKIQFDRRG